MAETATFRKGIDKVQESAERSKSFSGGNRFYFKWDPDEEKTVRFLTEGDEVVLTTLHEFVPCADNVKRSFVCRKEVGEECELCNTPDVKKREVAYAVAVWRYPVKQDGQVVFKTKTEEIEVDEDGKKVKKTVPWVGILQQAPRNFWSWFWSAYDKHGTLKDRDYSITRRGKGMETTYQPYPEDKQDFDESKVKEFAPNIEEMLTYLSSKEYYDAKLHGITADKDGESKGSGDSDLTDDDLAKLRALNAEVAAEASADFD